MKIGLDIGYSAVKLAFGSAQHPSLLSLPVGAAPLKQMNTLADGRRNTGSGHLVMVNDEEWIAGVSTDEIPDFHRVMDSSYATTPEYLALARAALSAVNASEVDCLVTGLPVALWQNNAARSALEQRLSGRHYIRPDLVVDVKTVKVVPQPAGALTSHMELSAKLSKDEQIVAGDSVLVVDPGHYSLDWIVYKGGFNHNAAGSTSSAGDVIVTAAARRLSDLHGARVPAERLEKAILSGRTTVKAGLKDVEFQEALEDEAASVVEKNIKSIRGSVRSVDERAGVDVVLIAGGGARLFEPALRKHFPDSRVVVTESSVMANARGFFSLCRLALAGGQKARSAA